MSRRSIIFSSVATALIAIALSGAGCKKEEQAKAPEAPPAPQAAAPAAPAAPAVPAAAVAGAPEYSFEDGLAGWLGTDKAVKTEPATDQKHEGKGSLKISGTAGEGRWNFATSPKLALEPGKKYKVSGWMYVDSWDKQNFPPLLKVGVNKDGKWDSNAFTTKYDLKKTKQWQQVGTVFTAPKDGKVEGYFSLEKGSKEPITATVYLDDLKLTPAK